MIKLFHRKLQGFNHLTRASDSVTDVRTGLNPVGVLKRVIRFKSCEKPNDQPVTTWPVGLLARLLLTVKVFLLDVPFTSGATSFGAGGFFSQSQNG